MSAPTLDPRRTDGPVRFVPAGGRTPGGPPSGRSAGSGENAPRADRSGTGFALPFLGAAAILAGSSALSVVIEGSAWVLPLIEVVLVVALIGLGCRMIRLPAAVTVLIQIAAITIALTSLFTSSGYGGVIPNVDVLHEMGRLFTGAWDQIRGEVPPAPATPQINFLISLAVGAAAIVVDFLVTEADSPALVALPLLCLYSVPASIADQMLPWYSFAGPAALYAVLLAVAGHRGRRTGWRAGVGLSLNGGAIAVLAIVVAMLGANLVSSVGTTGRLPKSAASTGQIGLSPFTSLQNDLKPGQTIDVLQVSGLKTPDYLRTTALTNWVPNSGWGLGQVANTPTDFADPLPGTSDSTDTSTVSVKSLNFRDTFLPILAGTQLISGLGTGWYYDENLNAVHRNGNDKVNAQQYSLQAPAEKASNEDLETDTTVAGGPMTTISGVADEVKQTAVTVTKNATTAFDKAKALTDWFTNPANGFTYSITVPPGNSNDALVNFLHNKKGYCEQYASAMAVMLRSLGIPARVAIGFTQGDLQTDGSYKITNHDAHAWVEVQFKNSGWVRFDPTPLVNGQGGEQGFTVAPTVVAATTVTQSETSTSESTSVSAVGPKIADDATTAVTTSVAAASGSNLGWLKVVGWSLLGAIVLFVLLLLPTALRQRRRRRRLAVVRSGRAGAATAAWQEIEDIAVDHGLALKADESARGASNRLAHQAKLGTDERSGLREVVLAAEREWYSAPGSPAANESASGPGVPAGPGVGADVATAERTDGSPVHGSAVDGSAVDGSALVRAVNRVSMGMRRTAPVALFDRWWPRSLTRPRR